MLSFVLLIVAIVLLVSSTILIITKVINRYSKKQMLSDADLFKGRSGMQSPLIKKYRVADISTYRALNTNIGLIGAIALSLGIFSIRVYFDIKPIKDIQSAAYTDPMVDIPITTAQIPTPPIVQSVANEIIEVPDNIQLTIENTIIDQKNESNTSAIVDNIPASDTVAAPIAPPIITLPDINEFVRFADVMPEPEIGFNKYNRYILKEYKVPQEALNQGVGAKIFVEFIVEANGSLSNIKALNDAGYGFGAEAERVIGEGPKWKPGKNNGRPVRVKLVLPINAKVQ